MSDLSRLVSREEHQRRLPVLSLPGHTVYLLCNDYGTYAARERCFAMFTSYASALVQEQNSEPDYEVPCFLNPLWIWSLFRATRKFKMDVLRLSICSVSPAVLAVGRIYRRCSMTCGRTTRRLTGLGDEIGNIWSSKLQAGRAVEKWVTKPSRPHLHGGGGGSRAVDADGVNQSRFGRHQWCRSRHVPKTSASVGVSFDPDPDAISFST